ncbi:uncharacterized protein DUF1896 [Mucilaginibacter gracilis]|uniref:Uncharacterized protein DUF1896 n=1 Tax=Mucilaginibacter gracilis TaxID=423350 RepID=A0A495IXU1_9SPHI|nr:DUF1896 family protein [Mucilaginibacter gracilis]RKR80689.1 uncharacterized protein DUF1896 [Mucilaginibacter gracilis]
MEEELLKKLHSFIIENNPDLLVQLYDNRMMAAYLEDKLKLAVPLITQLSDAGKPAAVIEEQCMNRLTADLRPSRFHYIREVLEDEFEPVYYRLVESGTLTYEIISLLEDCNLVFDDFGFSEDNENNRGLRRQIIRAISDYQERKE